MKTVHFLTGIPRSGSTLLADILSQNPGVFATSTSFMDRTVGAVQQHWSQAPELKSWLHSDRQKTEAGLSSALRGMVGGFYSEITDRELVVEKGRDWINHLDEIATVWPSAKVICTVRNPLDCYASVQKHHLKYPVLADKVSHETHSDKVIRYFRKSSVIGANGQIIAPAGMLGSNLVRLEDKLSHPKGRFPNLVLVMFEELVAEPKKTLRKLYADLELPEFEHNFEEVASTSIDLDAALNYKFPHRRPTGPIRMPDTDWRQHIPGELAQRIVSEFPRVFSPYVQRSPVEQPAAVS